MYPSLGRAGARRETLALLLVASAFLWLLFGKLAHPLLWQDEAETAMFASRVLASGYPKVHGARNVVNEFGPHAALGVKESVDAYIGKTWGDFYLAAAAALWAKGSDDLYVRTFRMRLPFAVTGALGLAGFAWAVWPVFGGDRRRALRFAALLVGLSALSISLILHLREVRYYALLVLLCGVLLGVHLRHAVFDRLGPGSWGVAVTALLVATFHVFFLAYFAFAVLLGAERLWAARRDAASARDALRRAALGLAPVPASALLLAPSFVFFETFSVARGFSESLGTGPRRALENLAFALRHLARRELLLPLVVVRGVRWALERGSPAARRAEGRCADLLSLFALGYTAIVCASPLLYERYLILLAPVLALVFLLDAFALADRARAHGGRAPAATLVALVALVAATSGTRLGDLRGRITEIRGAPYAGPLDFAIPWIRERFPRPEELVIATNYEAHAFMFYLGSHTIVGLSLNNLRNERALEPDLVIPRRRWPRSLRALRGFLATGRYETHRLGVRDLHYNNIPALTPWNTNPDPHRFETAFARDAGEALVIHRRVAPQAE